MTAFCDHKGGARSELEVTAGDFILRRELGTSSDNQLRIALDSAARFRRTKDSAGPLMYLESSAVEKRRRLEAGGTKWKDLLRPSCAPRERQRDSRVNFHIVERQARAEAITLPSGVQDIWWKSLTYSSGMVLDFPVVRSKMAGGQNQ